MADTDINQAANEQYREEMLNLIREKYKIRPVPDKKQFFEQGCGTGKTFIAPGFDLSKLEGPRMFMTGETVGGFNFYYELDKNGNPIDPFSDEAWERIKNLKIDRLNENSEEDKDL